MYGSEILVLRIKGEIGNIKHHKKDWVMASNPWYLRMKERKEPDEESRYGNNCFLTD
jgi:hypothetical protein